MKVVAVVQARMGSTRLPGKVMMKLGGRPVLQWAVRAARAAPGVDEVWVATSTEKADNAIEAWCNTLGNVKCWRGSETDVLGRFYDCTMPLRGEDIILRLTGDCPFLDPQVIGQVVRLAKQSGASYCSNVSPRTYPDGLDVEAFTRDALWHAYHEARRPIDRDCVTTFIAHNRSRFPAETVVNPLPGLASERWVLDTADDLDFCSTVASIWTWEKGPPSMLDILGILDRAPHLRELNNTGIMNERYFEALAEEPIYERQYTRSQAQLAKARAVIPLGAQTFSKSYLQFPQPSPLFVSHGDGGLVWDIDGGEYVDLVSALLPNILGYRDPDVDHAIRRQLSSGISFSLATELEAEVAETLCRLIPCAEAVRFGKTGTDVTTAAIRAARAFTGRDKVVICGGYHGWADWSVDHKRNLGVPEAVRALSFHIGLDDAAKMVVADNIAAVIIEPECGAPLLRHLREQCTRSGTILIFDEVITGFRYHLGGAQALYGVTPDLATFGKAMANGMPLSAVVGRRDIMAKFEPPDNVFYSGTMFGETLSLAAAKATIEKMEREDTIGKIRKTGIDLLNGIADLSLKHNIEPGIMNITGTLSFQRLKFRNDKIAALFRKEMIASGTLIIASHNLCAAHGKTEIRRVLKSYDHTLGILRQALDNDDFDERLQGASVVPMVRTS